MIDLKIGGVPEHFNYPWYLTLKSKEYAKFNINLRWEDYPGGTGQMATALREGKVDIAIILTEGIIKDIGIGNPSKIVQTYVKSPLIWGIHVGFNSKFTQTNQLEKGIIAISRYGSGSHLMAIVHAFNNGWNIDKLQFKVVDDMQGGIKAVSNGEADYFMWEHFTTKPFVDNNTLRRIGNCPTPWPCFVIAVRNEILENYPQEIRAILQTINQKNSIFKELPNIPQILAKRYRQKLEDVQHWLSITAWENKTSISLNMIEEIQDRLVEFNIVERKFPPDYFIKNL